MKRTCLRGPDWPFSSADTLLRVLTGVAEPRWSPDGSALAWVAAVDGVAALYVEGRPDPVGSVSRDARRNLGLGRCRAAHRGRR